MDWILLLVLAYFLISLSALVDKFILTKAVPEPIAYTVLVSTIGLVAVFLAPFGFVVPDSWQLFISLLAGGFYTLAIFFLYKSLQSNEASRVFPLIGALVAVVVFVLSFLFLGERLVIGQVLAFALLIVGGILIGVELKKQKIVEMKWVFPIFAIICFGISYTATKYLYSNQDFISAFIWIRIFAFLVALAFVVRAVDRRRIKASFDRQAPIRKKSNQLVLVFGQLATGLGYFLLNYVISLTSAAISLAGQGLQYAFLFIFGVILTKKFPQILEEKITPVVLVQKIIAIMLIASGLVILASY